MHRYQVKSTYSITAVATPKTETFPIPRVLIVRISRNEAIVDGLSKNEAIVDDNRVDNEENLKGEVGEQSGSEMTVMEIDNFRNECVRQTDNNLNRRLL